MLLAKKHYCSVRCQNLDKKKGQILACFVCGMKVYKKNKDILKSKSRKYFCSIKCSNQWIGSQRIGVNHPNWISGRSVYKSILSRTGKEIICKLCDEKDERILMTHHIDGNRENNSKYNLVWLCYNCHFLAHHDYKESIRLINLIK